jgi:hypothetical protein
VPPQAPTLVRDLKRFKSLKLISLIYDGPYSAPYSPSGIKYEASEPGQMIIEPAIFDWVYNRTETKVGDWPEIIVGPPSGLWEYLKRAKDSNEEGASSPDLDLVIARRLDDAPMREYQEACGLERSELYVGDYMSACPLS